MSFNKPIARINFDSIRFQLDSTTVLKFNENDFIWDFAKNTLNISKTLDKKLFIKETASKENKQPTQPAATKPGPRQVKNVVPKNMFTLGYSAFVSIDLDSSKSTQERTKILREEDTGIIIITIKTTEKKFLCQLLSTDYKIIKEVGNKKEIKFHNLPPANYIVRLVIDRNNNGKWDAGNFFKKEEAEPIVLYRTEKTKDQIISLKANWEIGPLLITY
jgi:hypothetical protein